MTEEHRADGASSSRRRPVRRELLPELTENREKPKAEAGPGEATSDWVQRAFGEREEPGRKLTAREASVEVMEQPTASWYRRKEEDAVLINHIRDQNSRWERAKHGIHSERVIPETESETGSRTDVAMKGGVSARAEAGQLVLKEVEGDIGLQLAQAHQVKEGTEEGEVAYSQRELGLGDKFSPNGVISPLKEFMLQEREDKSCGGVREGGRKYPTGTRKLTRQISKSLGPRKKIGHSPFRGSRIQKQIALVKADATQATTALAKVSIPSSSKTGPVEGKSSTKFKEPVVKLKPPANA